MKSPAQIEREVFMTYLTTRWYRSKLATFEQAVSVDDPGHGEDEVCPVLYWEQPFDPSNSDQLLEISDYAAEELSGYGLWELAIQDGTWVGQTLRIILQNEQYVLKAPGGDVVVETAVALKNGAAGVSFTVVGGETFSADVAATWLHGVGFVVVNLREIESTKLDQGATPAFESLTEATIWIAAPPAAAPFVADQYAGAIAMIFRGVTLRYDAGAAPGTPERDMADGGVQYIYQDSREAIRERPMHEAKIEPWQWYRFSFQFRRIYIAPRAGVQSVVAA